MSDGEATDRVGLKEYLVVLRRRWRLVAAVAVVVPVIALGYSFLQAPVYLATAEVLLEPTPATVATTGDVDVPPEEVATQARVVTSSPVAELVAEELSLSSTPDLTERVTVEAFGSSRILRISVRDGDADDAAMWANAVAESYLAHRQQLAADALDRAREELLQEEATRLSRLNEVNVALAKEKRPASELEVERQALLANLGRIDTEIASLQESALPSDAGGMVLTEAKPPESPISPRPLLAGVLGALFGLMLGAALAVLRDRLNDVVYDEDTMRRALGQSLVLGTVPRWQDSTYDQRLVSLLDPHSAPAEAYQRLGVNVRFLLATSRSRDSDHAGVVLVTSAHSGVGKTVTAANLAVAASRLGLRVVLIDADLRRADAASFFGLGDPPGLTDLLVGDNRVEPYLVDVGLRGLRFLPAGTVPPNPAALLGSARMRAVLDEVSAECDLVVVDSSPVLAVADALELAGLADLSLLVARHGKTRRRELTRVMEALRHVGDAPIGGVYGRVAGNWDKPYTYRPREQFTSVDDAGGDAEKPSDRARRRPQGDTTSTEGMTPVEDDEEAGAGTR
jgi:succinoglycan biosynthesis transport protein ExoP